MRAKHGSGSDVTGKQADGGRPRKALALFSVALREARARRALSQEALAEAAGLHPTFISLMERGRRQPSLETLLRLGRALGVPATELVGQVEASWEPEP